MQIEGLKRPFTDKQLREALQGADGKGRRDITWFWLNRNKSVCFAEFQHEREADAARSELYDLTWPPTSFSPGRLSISFTTREVANRTVAEEPVGVVRDPVSARLGHIPGVAGLPGVGVGGGGGGGGMRGWGSLADASAAARGGGGARNVPPVGARVGPIGGVAGFGIAGRADAMRSAGGGFETGGRGWGSLAAAAPAGSGPGRGGGGGMGDREDARNSGRGAPGAYESPRYAAPVRGLRAHARSHTRRCTSTFSQCSRASMSPPRCSQGARPHSACLTVICVHACVLLRVCVCTVCGSRAGCPCARTCRCAWKIFSTRPRPSLKFSGRRIQRLSAIGDLHNCGRRAKRGKGGVAEMGGAGGVRILPGAMVGDETGRWGLSRVDGGVGEQGAGGAVEEHGALTGCWWRPQLRTHARTGR